MFQKDEKNQLMEVFTPILFFSITSKHYQNLYIVISIYLTMMLKLQIKMSGCEAQMQPSQGIEVSRRYTYIGAWLKYAKILQ